MATGRGLRINNHGMSNWTVLGKWLMHFDGMNGRRPRLKQVARPLADTTRREVGTPHWLWEDGAAPDLGESCGRSQTPTACGWLWRHIGMDIAFGRNGKVGGRLIALMSSTKLGLISRRSS